MRYLSRTSMLGYSLLSHKSCYANTMLAYKSWCIRHTTRGASPTLCLHTTRVAPYRIRHSTRVGGLDLDSPVGRRWPREMIGWLAFACPRRRGGGTRSFACPRRRQLPRHTATLITSLAISPDHTPHTTITLQYEGLRHRSMT